MRKEGLILEALKESISDWSGEWVHYSEFPEVKVKVSKIHHLDPAGIYLFPKEFKPAGKWSKFDYRFRVQVPPSLRVLDLSKTSKEDRASILQKMGIRVVMGYGFWETMRSAFRAQPGLWNKKLRDLGYDAVFDDTNEIFHGETQLLVLDPTKIKVLERIDQTGPKYDDLVKGVAWLKGILQRYGKVTFSDPKKMKDLFSAEKKLKASIRVESGDMHATWSVKIDPVYKEIHYRLDYSDPRLDFGVGTESGRSPEDMEREVVYAMDKVFSKEKAQVA